MSKKLKLKRYTVIGVDHDYKPRTENTWLMRVLAPTPLDAALKAEEEGQRGSDGFQAIYVLNGWPSERKNGRSVYEDAKIPEVQTDCSV
jgi:hypothetical protein